MIISHISHADITGGAARAAWRIHQALREQGEDSFMTVNSASSGDWTVDGPQRGISKVAARVRPHIGAQMMKLQRSTNPVLHSPAILNGGLSSRVAKRNSQIVNLHWINGEMCSVPEIGRFDLPLIWTMHDMWPFCGAEHYTDDTRWKEGYRRDNRSNETRGFDIDRWIWTRKKNKWQKPIQLVAPSNWLAECARSSALMGDWPIEVIPNPLDMTIWKPRQQALARDLFGLPMKSKLVLFGAMGGTRDPRKGSDLLLGALNQLSQNGEDIELVVFGETAPEHPQSLGFPVHYMGTLHDEVTLNLLYSAADVFVLPSRQDNLPNTGVEAQASGRPVVAFDTGGLRDIVCHRETGYLARPFEVGDLAHGISWVLENDERWQALSNAASNHAKAEFDAPKVAAQYTALYKKLLGDQMK